MSRKTTHMFAKVGTAALLAAALTVGAGTFANAQTMGESDIAKALAPPPAGATRSLTITPISPPNATTTTSAAAGSDDGAFVDTLRNRTSRSLSTADRQKLAAIASDKPTVNLEIPFGYASAQITGRTMPAVRALGAALSRPEFRGGTFTIAGHTDGRGSDATNLVLSERRADAVKRFLVQNYGLPAANLISVGYGKAMPKNAADPYADENRRVAVTNISDMRSASR